MKLYWKGNKVSPTLPHGENSIWMVEFLREGWYVFLPTSTFFIGPFSLSEMLMQLRTDGVFVDRDLGEENIFWSMIEARAQGSGFNSLQIHNNPESITVTCSSTSVLRSEKETIYRNFATAGFVSFSSLEEFVRYGEEVEATFQKHRALLRRLRRLKNKRKTSP